MNQIVSLSQLAIRAENSERNRQVKTRAFLAHVSRREIDSHLLKRKEVAAVLNGRANAFARFAHGCVRQADNDDRRRGIIAFVTNRRQVYFDVDEIGVYAIDGGRECTKEHVRRLQSLE